MHRFAVLNKISIAGRQDRHRKKQGRINHRHFALMPFINHCTKGEQGKGRTCQVIQEPRQKHPRNHPDMRTGDSDLCIQEPHGQGKSQRAFQVIIEVHSCKKQEQGRQHISQRHIHACGYPLENLLHTYTNDKEQDRNGGCSHERLVKELDEE